MKTIFAATMLSFTMSFVVQAQPVTTKSFSPATINVGEPSVLTFDVTNPSTTVTLTGVSFTDNLTGGLVIASPNNLSGSCTGGSSGVAVQSGAAGTATLTVNTPAGPTVTETAFLPGTLSAGELSRLSSLCGFINANGSGFGVCRSCRLGGLGAGRI